MDTSKLDELLTFYNSEPDEFQANFDIALYYDSIGQTASAVSFYLRAAERTILKTNMVACLLKAANCFERQGARNFTVRGLLQHAIAIDPVRPEGYHALSKFFEKQKYDGHWNESYLIASIGDRVAQTIKWPLPVGVGYPGAYGIKFQKALSSWWCGLCEESKVLFEQLLLEEPLDEIHYKASFDNLKRLGSSLAQFKPFEIYRQYQYPKLIQTFPGCKDIVRNYSEAFQDMFVLSMMQGKCGTYVEVGAGHPIYGNNTYLLEQTGWLGVSLDKDQSAVDLFNKTRKLPCIQADATTFQWQDTLTSTFGDKVDIDYLQLDCDPPEVTYKALCRIPFDRYRFAVITYEHDIYCDDSKSFQDKSAEFLTQKGYLRVVKNLSPDGERSYEDWWVHPELIDLDLILSFGYIDNSIKKAQSLFLRV